MIADSVKHPPGIVVEIVGTKVGCQGRSCKVHTVCGSVLEEDMVVRLRKVQVVVEGREETAIVCYWVSDGIDRCHVGFGFLIYLTIPSNIKEDKNQKELEFKNLPAFLRGTS